MENTPKFCYNCGEPLPVGARFCASCGQAVLAPGAMRPTASPVTSTPSKRRTFSWPMLLMGIILGAVIGAGAIYLLAPKAQTIISQDWLGIWEVACSSDLQGNSPCFEQAADGKYRLNPSAKPDPRGLYFNLSSLNAQRLSAEIGSIDMSQPLQIELALSGDHSTVFGTASSAYVSQTFTLARRESPSGVRSQVISTPASNFIPAVKSTVTPLPVLTPQFEDMGLDLNLRLIFYGFQQGKAKNGMARINGDQLTDIQEITFLRFGGELSPDGSLIAYDDCIGHIYTIGLDGSTAVRRATAPATDGCHDIRWSPDGTKVSYGSGQGDGKLHVVDLATDQDRTIPNVTGAGRHWWSPTNDKVVYDKFVHSDKVFRLLFITDFDGNSHQLTFAEDFNSCERDQDTVDTWSPSWSPDGGTIAFTQCGKLFTISADGKDLRQLTEPIYAYSPRWSPDGDWVLFLSGDRLLAMSSDGQVTHEVGPLPYTGGPFSIGPLNQ